MVWAVRWNNCSVEAGSSHQDWTTALVARWTWQMVTSGFFPPQPLTGGREEQVTDRSQYQVSLQTRPASSFPMTQPYLALLVLEAAFDRPARKGDLQQFLQRRLGGSVADKVLSLAGLRVVAYQQMITFSRQGVLVFDVQHDVLDVPDDRPF